VAGCRLLNTYQNNHALLAKAFPFLFPLGCTAVQLRGTGEVKRAIVRRLMCSYDGRFATHDYFLFLLLNQEQRHSNNRCVQATCVYIYMCVCRMHSHVG
jgi:hypothetical protein